MRWWETGTKFASMDDDSLRRLYENTLRQLEKQPTSDAADLLAMIEARGVPPRRGSLSLDSPTGRAMEKVIFSQDGRDAALAAAQNGEAPLGRVDPLLQAALGERYRAEDGGTIQAGYLVAQAMRSMHWEVTGKSRTLPTTCVAKSAALFVHVPPARRSTP